MNKFIEKELNKKIITNFKFEASNKNELKKYIYRRLTSSKYKSTSVQKALRRGIQSKISICVETNKPIHISVPFGGYKNVRMDSFPGINWAEVFNLLYFRDYLSPICSIYRPGIVLEYFSDEIFIERMNNIDRKDLDIYNGEFEQLIGSLKQHLPKNFKVKYSKIRDQISQKEALARIMKHYSKFEVDFENMNDSEKKLCIKKAERNYNFNGHDYSTGEKYELLKDSYLIHELFLKTDWDIDVPWAFDYDMIPIAYRRNNGWGLHLRSARGSSVQFWVGEGVLLKKKEEYIPTILSYEQIQKLKQYDKIQIDIFSKKFKGLENIKLIQHTPD